MKKYYIKPYIGIDDIEFGMNFDVISRLDKVEISKNQVSRFLRKENMLITFDSEKRCNGIRLSGNIDVYLGDIELVNRPLEEVIQDLVAIDPEIYISCEPEIYSFRFGVEVFDMSFGAGARNVFMFPLGGCKLQQEMQFVVKALNLQGEDKQGIDEWMYASEYALAYDDIKFELENKPKEFREALSPTMRAIGAML